MAMRAVAAVVLEPTLGATVKKTALRVVGTILAGVAGLAILYLAGAGAGGFSYTLHPTAMAGVVTAFTAAAGALFMLLVSKGWGMDWACHADCTAARVAAWEGPGCALPAGSSTQQAAVPSPSHKWHLGEWHHACLPPAPAMQKLRYGAIEYCFTVVLITIPVVIVPGLR